MNSFKQQLEQYAQWTQECLEQFLPPQEGDRVTEAMRYSLLAGGKRLRAALALEFCRVLCGDAKRALTGACALEMVHAYSLIHDDLPCMDDDEMRRGKPSCHIAFGEAVALLAGDGLLHPAEYPSPAPCLLLLPDHIKTRCRVPCLRWHQYRNFPCTPFLL